MRTQSAWHLVVAATLAACGGGGGGGGAGGGGGGGGGGTCTTIKPLAAITWDSAGIDAPVRKPLTLNGGYSYSYNGEPLGYAWAITGKPVGSAAALVGSGSQATFTPDLLGSYTVSLVVSDSCGPSTPKVNTITTAEFAPAGVISPTFAVTTSPAGQLAIDGSRSSDPNGDPLTFSWTFTRPSGSTATLVDAAAPVARFTPDVEGNYQLQLVVSDGTGRSSYPRTSSIDVLYPAHGVPFNALDAAYSASLDRVVIITDEPALRLVNPHDGTSTAVPLDLWADAVSVSPDGSQAAVSQRNHFSLVRLVDPVAVVTTYYPATAAWTYDGGDVVLDGRGYAYAFPHTKTYASPFIVNLSTRAVTNGSPVVDPEGSTEVKPALDVANDRLYVLGAAYTYGIKEYNTPAGGFTYSRSSPGTSRAQGTGPWLAPDGSRIYGGNGDVWSPSTLTTTASLRNFPGDTASFDCVQDSTIAGKVVASTGGWGDDAFRVYERSLTTPPVRKHAPAVFSGTSATGGNVRWVFWKRDGSGYYAVFTGFGVTGVAEY